MNKFITKSAKNKNFSTWAKSAFILLHVNVKTVDSIAPTMKFVLNMFNCLNVLQVP